MSGKLILLSKTFFLSWLEHDCSRKVLNNQSIGCVNLSINSEEINWITNLTHGELVKVIKQKQMLGACHRYQRSINSVHSGCEDVKYILKVNSLEVSSHLSHCNAVCIKELVFVVCRSRQCMLFSQRSISHLKFSKISQFKYLAHFLLIPPPDPVASEAVFASFIWMIMIISTKAFVMLPRLPLVTTPITKVACCK